MPILEPEIPMLPNFLRYANFNAAIPVHEFTDKELRKIGKRWTDALVSKAQKQRKR